MEGRRRERRGVRRMLLKEAADVLGVSKDAVRQRIRRETLRADKGEDGRVYVYLDADLDDVHPTDQDPGPGEGDRYTRSLEEQVQYLRSQLDRRDEELREHRRLLAGLIERVPELQAAAPSEPTEDAETVEEEPERAAPRSDASGPQEGAQRPWWRRVFGS